VYISDTRAVFKPCCVKGCGIDWWIYCGFPGAVVSLPLSCVITWENMMKDRMFETVAEAEQFDATALGDRKPHSRWLLWPPLPGTSVSFRCTV
jgi:hypothetical protein